MLLQLDARKQGSVIEVVHNVKRELVIKSGQIKRMIDFTEEKIKKNYGFQKIWYE